MDIPIIHSIFRYFTALPSKMMNARFAVFTGMIVAAALSRILPHPPNFAPINAIALFAGTYLADKKAFACAVPLLAMLLSDAVLELLTGWGFHSGMWVIYACMLGVTALGFRHAGKRLSLLTLGFSVFLAAVLFFVVTNFAVWFFSGMYSRTLSGLQDCYTAALPFFQNSLAGDAFYSVILFGAAALSERYVPALRQV